MLKRRAILAAGASVPAMLVSSSLLGQELLSAFTLEEPEVSERQFDRPEQHWDKDTQVYIHRTDIDTVQGGGTTYLISGDIVNLSRINWPSLYRPPDGVLSGRTTLIVDAREVIVNMALRFNEGGLLIGAEMVRFGPEGVVSFRAPTQDSVQNFSLVARRINMAGARKVPFAFRTTSPGRSFDLRAQVVVDRDGTPVTSQENLIAFVRERSLDRIALDAPTSTGIALEEDAKSYWEGLAEANWPRASVLKVQRFFARAPYDEDLQAFLLGKIDMLEPALSAQTSATAELAAARVVQAIQSSTDLFGLLETAVPMTPLEDRLARFDRQIEQLYGGDGSIGEIHLWDRLGLSAFETGEVDPRSINILSSQLRETEKRLRDLDREAERIDRELTRLEDEIAVQNNQIVNQEERIRNQILADTYVGNDGVAQGITAVAAIGSIAFAPAAPYLLAVSGIVSAAYAAKKHGDEPMALLDSLSGIIQAHLKIQQHTASLRKNWSTVREKHESALKYAAEKGDMTASENDEFEEWKKSLKAMTEAGKTLYETLAETAETAEVVFDDERIARDVTLVRLVDSRDTMIEDQTKIMEELALSLRQYELESAEALRLTALLSDLQVLDLKDGADQLAYRQTTDLVSRQALYDLARHAVLLRRSLRYVAGEELDLPSEVLVLPEAASLAEITPVFEGQAIVATELARKRERQKANLLAIARRAESISKDAQDAEGWSIMLPIPFEARVSGNTGDPEAQKKKEDFVAALNGLLLDAIRSGHASASIPIPFAPNPNIPVTQHVVVAGINISNVSFANGKAPDSEFVLTIEHPRIGAMNHNGELIYYSDAALSDADASRQVARWPISIPSSVYPDWKTNITSDKILDQLDRFIAPVFAPFTASISVTQPDAWSEPPKIDAIALQFIVVKPT